MVHFKHWFREHRSGRPRTPRSLQRKQPLLVPAILATVVIAGGTLGFLLIEHWSLLDSFYMTIITVSTVGFREVHNLSPAGRLFTSFLILAGVGVATYFISTIVRLVVEGELMRIRERHKMQKKIDKLNEHTIVCGFGLLGSIVVRELDDAHQDVVVVDHDPTKAPELERSGIPFVEGSAYDDDVLTAAGIKRAKSLISLLPKDSDNVYVTLCARDLNPDLVIIARTEDEGGESKLRRAGANRVLAPYRVTGSRIVQQLIRPHVSDFLEVAVGKSGAQLALEEIVVPEGSHLGGKTLEESDLRKKTGAVVAAFIHPDGKMLFSPGGSDVITPGSTLIVFGETGSLAKLSELL